MIQIQVSILVVLRGKLIKHLSVQMDAGTGRSPTLHAGHPTACEDRLWPSAKTISIIVTVIVRWNRSNTRRVLVILESLRVTCLLTLYIYSLQVYHLTCRPPNNGLYN